MEVIDIMTANGPVYAPLIGAGFALVLVLGYVGS
jgi:hypothetical protein